MGLNEFILGSNDLEAITRALGFFKYTEHTVVAHSYRVASIARVLGGIEEASGQPIGWKLLYEESLNHDYTERFIGGIKTLVKYASKELRGMLQTVGEKMTGEFINQETPAEFQEVYRRRLFERKDETVEGELLAISDKVDLPYESFDEIIKNNPEKVYKEMFIEAVTTIKSFEHRPSAQYLFKETFLELLNQEFYGKEAFSETVSTIAKKEEK